MYTLRLVILFLFVVGALAAPRPERMAGLILTGSAVELKRSADPDWRPAPAGIGLFDGDSVRSSAAGAKVALCPVDKASRGRIVSLPAGAEFRVSASRPALPGRLDLPICFLPLADRVPVPGTLDDPDTRNAPEVPLAKVLAGRSPQDRAQFDAARSMESTQQWRQLAMATEGALLESFGLDLYAINIYRAIRALNPDATWTWSAIARITDANLASARLNGRIAKTVVDPSKSAAVDVAPDFSKGETFALLVGLSDYPQINGVGPLKFAHHDAETMRDYLRTARGGGVPDANILLLKEPEITRDNLDNALARFVKGHGGPNNTFIVFISGHGGLNCSNQQKCDPDVKGPFFIVRDGEVEAPSTSDFPLSLINQRLASRAHEFGRVLIYADMCHGGVLVQPNERNPDGKEVLTALSAGAGRLGVITGSSVNTVNHTHELSYEYPALQHGAFAYFLLEGLNGAVLARDDKVSFNSLANYVRTQVSDFTGGDQTPDSAANDNSVNVVGNAAMPGEVPLPDVRALAGSGTPLERSSYSADSSHAAPVKSSTDNATPPSPDARRTAFENEGQAVIVRYLRGEQDPPVRADFLQCAENFRQALLIAPDAAYDEARRLFCAGRAAVFDRNYPTALGLLQRSVRLDPHRSYAYNAIGIAYLEQTTTNTSNFANAEQAFRAAIAYSPFWAYPRHNLALALTESGNYGEAIAGYQAAMVRAPEYSYLPYNLGLLYNHLNRTNDALREFEEAQRIAARQCELRLLSGSCPDRAAPRTALGVLATVRHKRKQAETEFLQALDDDPRHVPALYNLAVLLYGWPGRSKEAEAWFRRVLAEDPNHFAALTGYAALLSSENRYPEAIPLYRRQLSNLKKRAQPPYVPAETDLAVALARTGQTTEAETLLKQVLELRPDYPGALALKAEFAANSGQWADADRLWSLALNATKDTPEHKQILDRRNELRRKRDALKINSQHELQTP